MTIQGKTHLVDSNFHDPSTWEGYLGSQRAGDTIRHTVQIDDLSAGGSTQVPGIQTRLEVHSAEGAFVNSSSPVATDDRGYASLVTQLTNIEYGYDYYLYVTVFIDGAWKATGDGVFKSIHGK